MTELDRVLDVAEYEATAAIRRALEGTGQVWPDHNIGTIALVWDGQETLIRWRAWAIPLIVCADGESIYVIRGGRSEDAWQPFEWGRGGRRYERWQRKVTGQWFLVTTNVLKGD